jgi:glycerophosphoryl diester phosphodiesterase
MGEPRRGLDGAPISRRALAAGLAAASLAGAGALRAEARRPAIVIARGGAAGGWPAGSRGAYEQAAADGADFLETGVAPTKDGVLIARQDNDLAGDTNVASRPEFADRRTTRVIDGQTRESWFCEDFTLAEIKSLALVMPRGEDRRPAADRAERPAVLTIEEIITTARKASVRAARVVGVYLDLLHPKYFAALALPLEASVAQTIRAQGYNAPAAALFVAADDPGSLKALAELTRARRVRRWRADQGPPPEDFGGLPPGLAAVALPASSLLDVSKPKTLAGAPVIGRAHDAGLRVHAWVGGEAPFPPPRLKPGDARRALVALLAAGVDGLCVDLAAPAVRTRSEATPGGGG